MRDPYLYPDSDVLKNKLSIETQEKLNDAEADYVAYRLRDIALNPLKGNYHTQHLLDMHKFIFQDLYDWAGIPRTILIYKEENINSFYCGNCKVNKYRTLDCRNL